MIQHKQLAGGRWRDLSLVEQLANVGSEVERAIELLTLTIIDPKNKKRLKELTRVREALVDYFWGENQYSSSDKLWQNYFYAFCWAARKDN